MNTQLRASPTIEMIRTPTTKHKNKIIAAPKARSLLVALTLSEPRIKMPMKIGRPEEARIPKNTTRSEMKSATKNKPKFSKIKERADLAESQYESPVTAMTIIELWFNTLTISSMHLRQQATKHKQTATAMFPSPACSFLYSWTILLRIVNIVMTIAPKVIEPRWNRFILTKDVV